MNLRMTMKRSRLFLQILLLALALLPGSWRIAFSQENEPSGPTLTGTEYYVAFMQNEDERGGAPTRFMGLMITSAVATTGQVTIPGSGTQSFTTTPGQVTTIPIPRTLEMTLAEEPPVPCVHITSRAPIAVFVLNSLHQSSAGYPAVPVDLWRSTYLPMSLPNADDERASQFMIIAAYETRVTISPSTSTNFNDAWQDITVNLKPGESYLVQARPGGSGIADLSTSEITSTRPIGVVAGHVRTPISPNRTISHDLWASHQAVMLLSDSLWGKEYYTVPMRATPDRFRLTPAFDNTTIEVTHYPEGKSPEKSTIKLNRGDIFDNSMLNGRPITGPVHWVSTEPFILMQLRTSSGYGDAANSPAMLAVPAMEQFSGHTTFAAPTTIGNNPISSHTLTIIAKGSGGDPLSSVAAITLNGSPLTAIDPAATWKKIDGNLYYVTMSVPSGGYTLDSPQGATFTATLTGNNGNLGDFYSWTAPFWVPQVEADATAPRVVETLPITNRKFVTVRISDRTPSYFSGVASVSVVNSPGWKLSSQFAPPYPDNDANVTFETTTDPSGPLTIEMRDRDGNMATTKVIDGICAKTAYADHDKVIIQADQGKSRVDSVTIRANPCGSPAIIKAIDLGTGNAKNYLRIEFKQNQFPIPIDPNGLEMLYFTTSPSTPVGRYVTTVTITLDTATIVLPVDLNVTLSGVAYDEGAERVEMNLFPNPFNASTQLSFGRALGRGAELTISDYLGRTIRRMSGEDLAGRTSVQWNGVDDRGVAAPAGVYIVTVLDGKGRSVRSATLIR